ncbi:MAG: GNAT family N-acetyltransferase [Chitinophagaceae bacterium]
MPEYIIVHTPEEYSAAAKLFTEYAAWLNIDLSFQHFESELKELSQMYAAPTGGIILCKEDENYIACVAIRKIDTETAELKRMYVQSDKQGKGIGKTILTQAIEMARGCGYQRIRLDTLDHMTAAINLYKHAGFKLIQAYYHNPIASALYFELDITR